MERNPMDEAISALKVAPVTTMGTCASSVASLYLFSTGSEWWGTAVVVTVIFMLLLWRATPGIIEIANDRARARHRYPH